MDPAGQDHWIDHGPAIVDHAVFENFQVERLRVELDDHGVVAVGGRAAGRPKVLRRLQPRLGAGLDRAAYRIGALRELAEPDEFFGDTDARNLAAFENEIILRAFEQVAGELQGLLPHHARSFVDRVAGDDRAAAGECPRSPIEPVSVAGDDIDFSDIDAELVGDDLRKAGKMPLPLGADSGGDIALAIGLHLNLDAFDTPHA